MRELWQHQKVAINAGLTLRDLGLFMDMGTGKSRTIIEILRRKYAAANRVRRTLIFCPIIVCENWKKEFGMYSKIPQGDIVVLSGSGKRRLMSLVKELGQDLKKNKIIITNYETVEMNDVFNALLQWQPEIMVCDESQKLKNPDSIRAKKVVQLADITESNYILTGTPILNSSQDIFMQFRVLDRGDTFGKNFYTFRHLYFEDENAGRKGTQGYFPKWSPKPFTFGELQDKISAKAIRVLKSECLDLPPLVRQDVYCEMNADQSRMYKEMAREYITWLTSKHNEPRAVVAQLAVTKALRLQQLVTGFVKDEIGTVHRLDNVPRLKVLKDLLVDLTPQHKVIVWANFKENYLMIAELCRSLGINYREIHGDIAHAVREKNMNNFRHDDSVRVMIANQSAAGVGVNLVEASYSIYYSKNFSLEADLQSEARNYRGGSEIHEKVTRIDIITRGTIDELVSEALVNKQSIADSILQWNINER